MPVSAPQSGGDMTIDAIDAGRNVVRAGRDIVQVGGDQVGGDKITYNYYTVPSPANERERRNRSVMLQKVYNSWIRGVFEKSFHCEILLDLDITYQLSAVAYPWDTVIELPDTTPPLLPGTSIVTVFDEAGGELLILGTPGSGKTTLLLDLARTLIGRAQQDEIHPIPVVFNLSSWGSFVEQQRSVPLFVSWLVQELNQQYLIPKKIAQAWIDADMVLPLLDGLDEVKEQFRGSCVQAINTYRQEHGIVGMVVCSRIADYEAIAKKLNLQSAVKIKPLSEKQIDAYLERLGPAMAPLRAFLQQDSDLRELATTPLLLNMLIQVYQQERMMDIPRHVSPEALRTYLFDTHIARVLGRRRQDERYSPQQTCDWLSWIAARMGEQKQTMFFLERIQPSWLPPALCNSYAAVVGTMVGLLFCLWLLIIFMVVDAVTTWPTSAMTIGSILIAVLIGLGAGLETATRKVIEPVESMHWSVENISMNLKDPSIKVFWMIMGICLGLVWILFALLIALQTSYGKGILFFLVFGMAIGIPLITLLGLSQGKKIETTSYPGERIWRSLMNFGIVVVGGTVLFPLMIGLLILLLMFFLVDIPANLAAIRSIFWNVWLLGMSAGMLIGFFFGGFVVIQYTILRIFLAIGKCIPLRLVPFLDYATERILLQKVGGGYMFIHRTLMEHFASKEKKQSAES